MSRRKSTKPREPNGRIQRKPNPDPPTLVFRARQAALHKVNDPAFASPFGWLYLSRQITDAQYAAGKKWAEGARDYSILCLAPKVPRSANLDPTGASGTDPDSPEGLIIAQQEAVQTPLPGRPRQVERIGGWRKARRGQRVRAERNDDKPNPARTPQMRPLGPRHLVRIVLKGRIDEIKLPVSDRHMHSRLQMGGFDVPERSMPLPRPIVPKLSMSSGTARRIQSRNIITRSGVLKWLKPLLK